MAKREERRMIKHVLADGTQVESMDGRIVTLNAQTEKAYQLLSQKEAVKNDRSRKHG